MPWDGEGLCVIFGSVGWGGWRKGVGIYIYIIFLLPFFFFFFSSEYGDFMKIFFQENIL